MYLKIFSSLQNARHFIQALVFNPSGTETGIVGDIQVTAMAADALDSYVTRTSATMTMHIWLDYKGVHAGWFQLPTPSQCWKGCLYLDICPWCWELVEMI